MFQTTAPFLATETAESRSLPDRPERRLAPGGIDGATLAMLMARARRIRSEAMFDLAGRIGQVLARPFRAR